MRIAYFVYSKCTYALEHSNLSAGARHAERNIEKPENLLQWSSFQLSLVKRKPLHV